MLNKKAQVGESITWVVATIIVIVLLLIFIYASILLSKTKSLESGKENSEYSFDWINSKTQIAYSINDKNKDKIEDWISQSKKDE